MTDKTMTLETCPFCGGKGEYKSERYSGVGASGMEAPFIYAGCRKCNVWFGGGQTEGPWNAESRKWEDRSEQAHNDAAFRWNTRHLSQPAERGEAVSTVYVCSNANCQAVHEADPCGHCPACISPDGSGWSTIPRKLYRSDEWAPYLKEGETPFERFLREVKDCDSAVELLKQERMKAERGEAVAWMSPGKERLEFSRPDTVYGSHTIPLYAAPPPAAGVPDWVMHRATWLKDITSDGTMDLSKREHERVHRFANEIFDWLSATPSPTIGDAK